MEFHLHAASPWLHLPMHSHLENPSRRSSSVIWDCDEPTGKRLVTRLLNSRLTAAHSPCRSAVSGTLGLGWTATTTSVPKIETADIAVPMPMRSAHRSSGDKIIPPRSNPRVCQPNEFPCPIHGDKGSQQRQRDRGGGRHNRTWRCFGWLTLQMAASHTAKFGREETSFEVRSAIEQTFRHPIPAPCSKVRGGRPERPSISTVIFEMVRSRRLELPRVAPLAPQASASTVPPRPHCQEKSGRRRGLATLPA
jgi:hypothetical protein